MSPPEDLTARPSLAWRASSGLVIGVTGVLCKAFMRGASYTEVNGYDKFIQLLDERRDVQGRRRGLITVSNHLSVMDDPLIWGVLPFHLMGPDSTRWTLGSYDICFKNKFTSAIFTFGQVLPTHRLAYSPYGGLFQPTMTEAIRLLSSGPFSSSPAPTKVTKRFSSPDISDPFSSAHLTYSTNGVDTFPAASAYENRKHAWVHIFPEGKIHQKSDKTMRYFKWGIARLILESEPCPDVVPMWIEGTDQVLHEARRWPRPIPRPFKEISITFGETVDTEDVFGDLRDRWRRLVAKELRNVEGGEFAIGELTEELKHGEEAVELRKECTMRVRQEVLKVRRSRGLPDEDPKVGLAETWKAEGGKKEGKMEDGSWVKDI